MTIQRISLTDIKVELLRIVGFASSDKADWASDINLFNLINRYGQLIPVKISRAAQSPNRLLCDQWRTTAASATTGTDVPIVAEGSSTIYLPANCDHPVSFYDDTNQNKIELVRLQLFDLDRRTMTRIQDDAAPASWRNSLSPRGDRLAIRYPDVASGSLTTLALLDLSTLEKTEVAGSMKPAWFWVQWDPAGERMAFTTKRTEPGGEENYVLAIYSLPAVRTIAERVIARDERAFQMFSSSWTPDGRSLVIPDPEKHSLRILGPDLQETGRIELPARIKQPWGPRVVRDQVLVQDAAAVALWGLDLGTKRWKRLF